MNIEQVKQLIELMVDNDLSELDISDGEAKVRLRRGPEGVPTVTTVAPAPMAAPDAASPPQASSPDEAVEPVDDGLVEVHSPMVGTFYAASDPESDPFASVGDSIGDDSIVCIIEAMKVMNEIKADCSGTIAEVCVQNAQPVEFGQVLFRVKPN